MYICYEVYLEFIKICLYVYFALGHCVIEHSSLAYYDASVSSLGRRLDRLRLFCLLLAIMGQRLISDQMPHAFDFETFHFHLFITQSFPCNQICFTRAPDSLSSLFGSTPFLWEWWTNSASLFQTFTLWLFISLFSALFNRLWWYGCALRLFSVSILIFSLSVELFTLFFWK